jgi:hypothetical protein
VEQRTLKMVCLGECHERLQIPNQVVATNRLQLTIGIDRRFAGQGRNPIETMPVLGQRRDGVSFDVGKVPLCILAKTAFQHIDHPSRPMFLDRSRQVRLKERGEVGRSGWFARKVKYGRVWPPRKSGGFRYVAPRQSNSSIEPRRRVRGSRQLIADHECSDRREECERVGTIETGQRERIPE